MAATDAAVAWPCAQGLDVVLLGWCVIRSAWAAAGFMWEAARSTLLAVKSTDSVAGAVWKVAGFGSGACGGWGFYLPFPGPLILAIISSFSFALASSLVELAVSACC